MKTYRYLFGELVEATAPLTSEDVVEISRRAHAARARMIAYPQDKVLALLGRIQKLWKGEDSPYRKRAMEVLPEATGFSRPMLELGLEELVWTLDSDILRQKLAVELGDIPLVIGEKFNSKNQTSLKYLPIGTVLHVLSGNVFLVGPGSLVEGLITGNVNILKMPSEEKFFLPLFLESLKEADTDGVVASSIAAIDYSSSQTDVIETLKNQMDAIVVWGGEQAVQAYRFGAPARSRLIVFGPKLSFAVVTAEGMKASGPERIAEQIAKEIVIWDQQACTAPQSCYVEGEENARLLMEALPAAMARLQKQYPPGGAARDAAVEIRKARGVAEVREALGEGLLRDSGFGNLDFTFLMDKSLELEPSPLNRTLRVVPYHNLSDVMANLEGLRGYLQTVGLEAGVGEWSSLVDRFSLLGALRVLPLGTMSGGEIDDPHDGLYDLPQYLNLVVSRSRSKLAPFDRYDRDTRKQVQDAKLRILVGQARRSEFFAQRLGGVEVSSLEDLTRVPLLTRADWEAQMPPQSATLQTRESVGGYVTRSGGSTGVPKFSIFDGRDWSAMLGSAVAMMEAAGFSSGDRIANFWSAGDLYGSFVSFNHVNFELGAQSYCFAHVNDPANFLPIARDFKINAIQGVPPTVMKVLRGAKELDPSFTIEKVMFAGMPMAPADREWLEREVNAKIIVSVIGTTEANHIGYQCPHLRGSNHHLVEDYNLIEIVDENGAPVRDGETGRIAVTNLEKWNYPVIRYLNGDAGRIVGSSCKCGRSGRVLEYLGRWDDIVAFGNMNIVYGDVVKALEPVGATQVQMVLSFREGVEHMKLAVETESVVSAEDVVELLKKGVHEFDLMLSKGQFSFETRIGRPGSIPTNARTGKVKGVVDERQKTLVAD